mmetsp:Transcript_177376/g.568770  ORF Transcript_177376/g.568770 Transcript_177376/m.568770 type:complete len:451 (+) Transcript_177376:349-1701(+)
MALRILRTSKLQQLMQTGGAGTAVAFCGLWVGKALSPPEGGSDPSVWLRRRTVRAAADPAGAARESALLEKLAACDLSVEELRAAASRSWSGVEFCAYTLGSETAASIDALRAVISTWRASGALDTSVRKTLAVETRRSYATDVGCTAPTFLGKPEDVPRLAESTVLEALGKLEQDGAAMIQGAIDKEVLRQLRLRLKVVGGGGAFGCPTEISTSDILDAVPGIERPQEPSSGRRHFLIRGSKLAEEEVLPLLAPLMPLVYSYFATMRPDAMPGSLLSGAKAEGDSGSSPGFSPRLFFSECQVLATDPGAVPQIWHRDNLCPGLTILMPLTDVDDEVGPTQVLPGTHRLVSTGRGRSWTEALAALGRSAGAVAVAPATAGDVVLYDARLLHRGLGNSSYGRCRVVIAIRLDYCDTPPPGETLWMTQVSRIGGSLLHSLGSLYSLLPVPQR